MARAKSEGQRRAMEKIQTQSHLVTNYRLQKYYVAQCNVGQTHTMLPISCEFHVVPLTPGP